MKKFVSIVAALSFGLCFAQAVAQEGGGTGDTADPFATPDKPKEEEKPAETTTPEVAAPDGYPISTVDRPLALNRMMLEPNLDFFMYFDTRENTDNWFGMIMGAGFGIINNLEAGMSFPVLFSPQGKAGELGFYGLYDLSSLINVKNLKLAGMGSMSIGTSEAFRMVWGADFVMLFDGIVKYKIVDMFAIRADIGLGFSAGPGAFAFNLELAPMFQPLEALLIELRFGVKTLAEDASITRIPLYLYAQYTLIGNLDLYLTFGFPDLKGPGADLIALVFGAAYRFQF
jgi:hypothetical protein